MKRFKNSGPPVTDVDRFEMMKSGMTTALLSRLGSIIVHFDEYCSDDGREIDKIEAMNLLDDSEVKKWLKDMGPLVPAKRCERPK